MKRKMLLAIAAATLAGSALAATPAVTRGDVAKGKVIAEQVCAACHGADGNSVASANPSLAGQHAKYLESQLKAFKSGERKNPIMLGMAATLTEQDMRDIGAYFATQKVVPGVADDTVIAEGPRELRDMGFLNRAGSAMNSDALRYEKQLIDDWLRRDLEPVLAQR